MKLLFILGILALLGLMIYMRLRPYIRMMRKVMGVAGQARRVVRDQTAQSSSQSESGQRLVRCAACGTWVPSSRAVKLRSSDTTYCSHTCLEEAAQVSERKAG